jgi:serine-type D-Ala-D-Ala endopeptidase (penicillin-binding protein 7)
MKSVFKIVTTTLLSALIGLSALAPAEADAAGKKRHRGASHAKSTATKVSRAERMQLQHAHSVLFQPLAGGQGVRFRRVALRQDPHAGRFQRVSSVMRYSPARPSMGQIHGLHNAVDALELKSSVAFVVDAETNEVLVNKNSQVVLPIASLTKLMTALVVAEARQPLNELLTINAQDIDTEKGSRSRLSVGATLSREEMLHLALMSSENRAANALGRSYPGGLNAFVAAMNRKARDLGMNDTHYVEPTGLSSLNQSSARDLVALVRAAQQHKMIREFSTSTERDVALSDHRVTSFRTTNSLVRDPDWDIALQKTGYIAEAGRCLVMQTRMAGRVLIMVFLDSSGKYSRQGDAERVRRWVLNGAQKMDGAQKT